MKYKHIIFDIDGTLLDSSKAASSSLQKTVKDLMGLDMSDEKAYSYFGLPTIQTVKNLKYPDIQNFLDVWENNFQALWNFIRPFNGVFQLLNEVKKAGLGTGIVTSRNRMEIILDPFIKQMLPYIDHVVTSEDTVKHKPDPDPLLEYCRKANASPNDCLFVGDTDCDSKSSHAANIDFVLACWQSYHSNSHESAFDNVLFRPKNILDLLPILGLGELTHVNNGEINMIDVSAKVNSLRTAYAHGEIHMDRYTIKLIKEDKMKKGSVLTVAEIAGIQAAKNTSSLIPLSHNIPLSKIEVKASLKEDFVKVETMSRCIGQTGVEMEALTAASIALLTIYDMCKAVDKSMVISNITLLNKTKDRID